MTSARVPVPGATGIIVTVSLADRHVGRPIGAASKAGEANALTAGSRRLS